MDNKNGEKLMFFNKIFTSRIYLLLIISIFFSSALVAQNNKQKGIDLNEFMGARLYKVFKTFGNPRDLFCSADGNNETIMDYGSFAFQIGNKEVTIVYFWDNFPGKVFGVAMGTSKTDLEKQYGKPDLVKHSKIDGNLIWIYNLPDTDRMFIVFFDKNEKIKRMQIEWLS